MSKRNITLIALLCAVVGLLLNLLPILFPFEPDTKIGWYDMGESHWSSINSTLIAIHVPFWIIYTVFSVAYMWIIKKMGNNVVGNIAIVLWMLWIVVDGIEFLINAYSTFQFQGEEFIPSLEEWENRWCTKYPLVYFRLVYFQEIGYVLAAFGTLSHLAFIPAFVAIMKRSKAVGILGILTMALCLTSWLPINYLYFLPLVAWIPLFAVSWKWMYDEERDPAKIITNKG